MSPIQSYSEVDTLPHPHPATLPHRPPEALPHDDLYETSVRNNQNRRNKWTLAQDDLHRNSVRYNDQDKWSTAPQHHTGATRALGTLGGRGVEVAWVMIYGTAEMCAKTECGITFTPISQTRRMDKDGTLDISFDEWRDYLLFHPSANLHDIIMYWRHATTLDVGEDLSVPDDFSLEEWMSGKWWRHLVAGGVAGAVSRTCTAPLDRLKIFLQVYGNDKKANKRSIRDVIKYMLAEGGVKGFWRGNGINVLKIAPESAIKFAAYEKAKKIIKGDKDRECHVYERLLAGSTAGAVSQTTIYPMEVLKTRLALRKTGQYKSIADCASQIFQREGLRPFYRGYLPNLIGIIPYAGIDLAVYETLKRYYIKRTTEEGVAPGSSPVLVTVCCGALSSTCGQMASYPLALVRTRLQAQVIAPGVKQYHPPTMSSLFKHIIATEGFRGLYRGITPNFCKVIPAVSISYVVYEKCRDLLGVGMT